MSVGADHHDYPAADIAAPQGSPLYALSDGQVVDACRRRLALRDRLHDADAGRARRGRTATSPTASRASRPGAALTAGEPVGLVGSTGHATGPHLHLQLQPPTLYPQQQAWFQSFAGSAFRWQGDPPPLAAPAVPRSRDVFAVEGDDDVVYFNR